MLKKRIFYFLLSVVVLCSCLIYFSNKIIAEAADGKLFSSVKEIPYNKTGLLLGTAKLLGGGYLNPYYKYRIDAALALINSGKIRYLVISGDNGRNDYNEPRMMKDDLITAGVDSNFIFLDYAGFRTFDSVVRLREIFSQDSVTVISQQFHNERALYIASREKINAIGFNAKDVTKKMGLRTQVREKFARVKVFLDYLTGAEPKFLGPKIIIPV